MTHPWITLAAVYGLLGVVLGAFGAHALRERLPADLQAVWQTAVQYQFWHALALLAVGLLAPRLGGGWLTGAGVSFALGVLVFSGSLYALALSGVRVLGAVTPIGGVLLIGGWVCLLVASVRG